MNPNNVKRIKQMTREINALNKRIAELFAEQDIVRNVRDYHRTEAELYIAMNKINAIAVDLERESRIAAEVSLEFMSDGALKIVAEDTMNRMNKKTLI